MWLQSVKLWDTRLLKLFGKCLKVKAKKKDLVLIVKKYFGFRLKMGKCCEQSKVECKAISRYNDD